MMLIDQAELHGITLRVFEAAGSDHAEAQIIADHLIEPICAAMTATASG